MNQNKISNKKELNEKSALEQATQELDGLSFAISHDFRNVINHISGFLKLLEMQINSSLKENERHNLVVIHERLNYLDKMIEEIHQYSRIIRTQINLREIKLNKLFEDVRTELQPSLNNRNIVWNIAPLPNVVARTSY